LLLPTVVTTISPQKTFICYTFFSKILHKQKVFAPLIKAFEVKAFIFAFAPGG